MTTATGSVSIAIVTNPSAATLSGTTPRSAVNGVATFDNLSIDQAGTGYALRASSTGLTPATTQPIDIAPAGTQVLGISVDSVWAHMAFAKQMGLKYPLLADFQPRGEVAGKFGLYLADKGITARATVIVDKKGKVAWVKQEEIPQARDNKVILAELAKLG